MLATPRGGLWLVRSSNSMPGRCSLMTGGERPEGKRTGSVRGGLRSRSVREGDRAGGLVAAHAHGALHERPRLRDTSTRARVCQREAQIFFSCARICGATTQLLLSIEQMPPRFVC